MIMTTKVRLTTRSSRSAFTDALRQRQEFTTNGSLRGELNPVSKGRLPHEYWASFYRADYGVYSYDTPIAWHIYGAWVFPDESYSLTTTRHQATILVALTSMGVEVL